MTRSTTSSEWKFLVTLSLDVGLRPIHNWVVYQWQNTWPPPPERLVEKRSLGGSDYLAVSSALPPGGRINPPCIAVIIQYLTLIYNVSQTLGQLRCGGQSVKTPAEHWHSVCWRWFGALQRLLPSVLQLSCMAGVQHVEWPPASRVRHWFA